MKNKALALTTHASSLFGPPVALLNHLNKNEKGYLVFLSFPLTKKDEEDLGRFYRIYKDGEIIEEKKIKFSLKPFKLNFFFDGILQIFYLWRLKRRYKLDYSNIFACNNLLTFFVNKFRFLLKPEKLIFYSVDYSDERFDNRILNNIYLFVDKNAARKADFVWSNTNRTRKIRASQGTNDKANMLVPNGANKSVEFNNLNLSPEKINLVYHGYISIGKGLQHILKALSELKNESFTFDIYGYGPYEVKLKQMVKDFDLEKKVKFKGIVDYSKLVKLIPNYDLDIALIYGEEDYIRYCDPMKVKDAIVGKVPVLVSSVPEVSEMIAQKELGLVIENPEDSNEIKIILEKIFKDKQLLDKFKHNVLNVSKEFTWNYIFKKALNEINA